ncbi:MAG: phosphomannomutase/phosphoglucomutase, partial [Nitrospirae bacterium]|nr:phosphomannomutase/phosphoglucomutase [Nitrospirota bacterium]
LGRAFAGYLRPLGVPSVTIGYDARLSSPRLRDALGRGLTASGLNVIDIGLCPTPALYFSLHHLNPGAGIMITGSHNPSEFNGFKLCVGKDTIYGEEIQKVGKIVASLAGSKDSWSGGRGAITDHPIIPDYAGHLKGLFRAFLDVPLKVVLDSGNGTAGLIAPEVIRSMGCEVIELYSEPDGRFPNHHPDPTIPKNLETLISTVKSSGADLGIAFDGDSDRIGVVDEKGAVLWGDQLMVLFSRDILRERPGATFVSEVKCSQTMYDDIRTHGGTAIMWKTGHSLIKAKMKESGAALAGEMSGHIFFADRYFGYDDAIYAACRVVELLKKTRTEKKTREPLSSLIADLPKTFNTPEIRFDCPDALKFKVVDRIRELYAHPEGMSLPVREVIIVDGVRAVFQKGWGLIRASNTQPVLVMRFEAVDETSLRSIRALMEQQVKSSIASLS